MNGDQIQLVNAHAWVCGECHDLGLANTHADAERALLDHREDYH